MYPLVTRISNDFVNEFSIYNSTRSLSAQSQESNLKILYKYTSKRWIHIWFDNAKVNVRKTFSLQYINQIEQGQKFYAHRKFLQNSLYLRSNLAIIFDTCYCWIGWREFFDYCLQYRFSAHELKIDD